MMWQTQPLALLPLGALRALARTSACDPSPKSNASHPRTLEGATTRFAVVGDYGTGTRRSEMLRLK